MGFFRVTPEERAAQLAAFDQEQGRKNVEDGRARRPQIDRAAAERAAAWREMGAPEGIVFERIGGGQMSTEAAWALLAQYLGATGLRPEDVWTVQFERPDNYDVNNIRGVAVLYHDRPEYAAPRAAYWQAHPECTPADAVAGRIVQQPTQELDPEAQAAEVRKQIADR